MLFTASSVRVDRRGTCSIGSKAAAARGHAGSRRRCRARSLGATWTSARATPGPAAAARAQAAAWPRSRAATCAGSTAASIETRTESTKNTTIHVTCCNTVYTEYYDLVLYSQLALSFADLMLCSTDATFV